MTAFLKSDINIIDQLPGCLAWKDKDFRYLGCNNNLARSHKLQSASKILGLKDEDLVTVEASLEFYRKYDQIALSGKAVKILHSEGSPDANKSYLLEKKPLRNNEGQIMGLIYYCNELPDSNVLSILQAIDKKVCPADFLTTHYNVGSAENPFNLSTRELECLFCILRGMTAKKCGEIIGLSKRTIEFYIDNIKNKLGCSSKSELLVVAVQAGYMNLVLPRFLQSDLSQIF
jgi:DNA-binding CsgD family transcriptional regulator